MAKPVYVGAKTTVMEGESIILYQWKLGAYYDGALERLGKRMLTSSFHPALTNGKPGYLGMKPTTLLKKKKKKLQYVVHCGLSALRTARL